jgi:hypothetical protein
MKEWNDPEKLKDSYFAPEDFKKGVLVFITNCLGFSLRITCAFLTLLEHSKSLKRLCYISSEVISISVYSRRDEFIHPISKTVLNGTTAFI